MIFKLLYNFFITFKFHRFSQSGGYFDFFYKKISEVFLRNFFVYSAQFFAEKYMIEVLTKKIIDNSIYVVNKYIGWNNLKYFNFFFQIIAYIFYLSSIVILFLILI